MSKNGNTPLSQLAGLLARDVTSALTDNRVTLAALPATAEALVVLGLARRTKRLVVWIHEGAQALEQAHRDLITASTDINTAISIMKLGASGWSFLISRRASTPLMSGSPMSSKTKSGGSSLITSIALPAVEKAFT